jgi:hypothetical protein
MVTDGKAKATGTQGSLQAEIVLGSGRRVLLSGDLGPAELAELVAALEGGVPC